LLVVALPKGSIIPDLPIPEPTVITIKAVQEPPAETPPAIVVPPSEASVEVPPPAPKVAQEALPPPKEKELKPPAAQLPKAKPSSSPSPPKPKGKGPQPKGKGKEKLKEGKPSPPPSTEEEKEEDGKRDGGEPRYPPEIRLKARALLGTPDKVNVPKWACRALVRAEADAAEGLRNGSLTAATFNDFLRSHPLQKKGSPKKGGTDVVPTSPLPKGGKAKAKKSKEAEAAPANDDVHASRKEAENLKSEWARESQPFKVKDVKLLAKPRSTPEKGYKKLWDRFLVKRKALSPAGKKVFRLPRLMAADGTPAVPKGKKESTSQLSNKPAEESKNSAPQPGFAEFMEFFKAFNAFKSMSTL